MSSEHEVSKEQYQAPSTNSKLQTIDSDLWLVAAPYLPSILIDAIRWHPDRRSPWIDYLEGSPGLILEGMQGACDISQGVICAVRHIHMTPEDALSFGLRDRDVVMVRVEGERTLTFGDILVRVDPNFRLSMHIDTDEANAASITTGMIGHLASIQARS